jgi:hypothetical protein
MLISHYGKHPNLANQLGTVLGGQAGQAGI